MNVRRIALTAALLVSGCGFHFAGKQPVPAAMTPVYVDVVTPYQVVESPLETALIARLRGRGAEVTGSPDKAKAVLRLSDFTEKRDVLSIGPDGKAVEFRLSESVTYTLISNNKVLVPPGDLSVSHDLSFKAQEVLAKEAEENRLRQFMQDELADLILLRLEAVLTHPPRTASD